MKHAYCIIAHHDHYCLNTLVELIDDERNDIFLLLDKKTPENFADSIFTNKSSLYIIPFKERIDIRWGGVSQVKAELLLFKKALETDHYELIHLLSGSDLPIKTQDYIHNFFNNATSGTNFVAFSHGEAIKKNVDFKTRFYHPFVEHQRFRKDGNFFHLLQDFSAKAIRQLTVKTQQIAGFKRNWKNLELKKGSQWVSISADFARYLTERENFILKNFRNVICADEIFLHTLLYNSPFKSTIYDYKGEKETLRLIDWKRGNPYIWTEDDIKELEDSHALFARKFSSSRDKNIIDKIKTLVKKPTSPKRY